MENNQLVTEGILPKMELNHESLAYLSETRKWTLFLSILGFIFVGFLVIGSFSVGAWVSMFGATLGIPLPGASVIVLYLILALIYFFPIYYLYKFGSLTKRGIAEMDNATITLGFKNLKSHYKYVGILTIVLLSIYFLVFGIMLLTSLF